MNEQRSTIVDSLQSISIVSSTPFFVIVVAYEVIEVACFDVQRNK